MPHCLTPARRCPALDGYQPPLERRDDAGVFYGVLEKRSESAHGGSSSAVDMGAPQAEPAEMVYGGVKGEGVLVPPEVLEGTFSGNGCFCTPACIRELLTS